MKPIESIWNISFEKLNIYINMITKFDIFKDKLFESLPRDSTVKQLQRIRHEIMGNQEVKVGPETTFMHSDVGDRVIDDLKTHKHNNLFWWDNPVDRYICSYEDFVKHDARKSLGYTIDDDPKPEPTDIPESEYKDLSDKKVTESYTIDLGWIKKRIKDYMKSGKDENDFYHLVDGISVDLNIKGQEEKVEKLGQHLSHVIDELHTEEDILNASREILSMEFLFENKKMDSWEKEKERIRNMSEEEFTNFCRISWNKYQSKIKHSDDSIPFWEWYSEQCAIYGREQK